MLEDVGQFISHLRLKNVTTNYACWFCGNSALKILLTSWLLIETQVCYFSAFGQDCSALAHHHLFRLHRFFWMFAEFLELWIFCSSHNENAFESGEMLLERVVKSLVTIANDASDLQTDYLTIGYMVSRHCTLGFPHFDKIAVPSS